MKEKSAKFWLADDKDSANVRFIMNSWYDVFVVHTHEIMTYSDDKERKIITIVKCLGDDCIECRYGRYLKTQSFIPIYNEDEDAFQYWPRTNRTPSLYTCFDQMFKVYDDIPFRTFKITRIGHKGDPKTKYAIDCIRKNEKLVAGEFLPLEGTFYHEVTENQMKDYLEQEKEIIKSNC